MRREIEAVGRTVEEAINRAVAELGVDRDAVDVEVIDEGSRGLLGLVARREARVRVARRESKADVMAGLLKTIARAGGVEELRCEIRDDDGKTMVEAGGRGVGWMIGRKGSTLEAIQYLLNVAGSKVAGDRVLVIIDIDGYRRRREERLVEVAQRAAEKAKRTGKAVRLEPMSAYERRIVHLALQRDSEVRTASEGEEPFRKVVVARKDG